MTDAALAVRAVAADAPEVEPLVAVLRRAFAADAHILWLMRRDGDQGASMNRLFLHLIRHMGGELHATADLRAAALWQPPGGATGWAAEAGFFSLLVRLRGPALAIPRGLELKRMEARHPAAPHYTLRLLGVDPEWQRRGHGAALLGRLQQTAAAGGHGVYLETSRADNAAYYERHGFRETARTRLSGGLELWSMQWSPGR